MKQNRFSSLRISFSRGIWLYVTALLLLLPIRLLAAMMISAIVHELFHILAIRLLGLNIYSLKIGIFGARIHTEQMTDAQELICALAGPLGGLSLLLFAKWLPVTCLCACVQSVYNLLPIYPADGGRILLSGAKLLLSDNVAAKLAETVQRIALIFIFSLSVYGSLILRLGVFPLLVAIAIGFGVLKNK